MLEAIRQAVLAGDIDQAGALTEQALAAGTAARAILDEALTPAMDVVGQEYESGERFVPEMLISAEAMKASLVVLKPLLAEAGVEPRGRIVLGTVEGDLHDIGKDLVAMMLEGAGFEVTDLGIEVAAGTFVEAMKAERPHILGMSALLTTTMVRMPEVIEAVKSAGLREGVKIMVGGAPVTQEFADDIGADGYAADAAAAARLAVEFRKAQ